MKVRIDSDACQGHGHCVNLCPSVFSADSEGFGIVQKEDVPSRCEGDVERAAASCPERAIHLTR